MKPILFSIGDLNIYSYGLCYALALIVGLFLAEYRAKKHGLDHEFIFSMGFIAIILGVVCAKLLYLITIADQLFADFWNVLKNSISEGFVVYGGIIGAALTAIIYCRIKKKSFLEYFDIAAPSIAIGQAIGRVGCLLAGCCYGSPTDAWYGITFPEGAAAPVGVSLYPTQPLSTIFNLINFGVLLFAYKKFKRAGQTFALYMINYGVGRFLIEFIRDDYRGEVGIFSTSQFISLFVVILGVILMFTAKPKAAATDTPEQILEDEINAEN